MKILLFGAAGQVGWELQRSLAPLGEVVACDRQAADLSDLMQVRATIHAHKPSVIVNAAAYTAVDKAESEPDLAQRINAVAVGVMAEEAKQLDAWLVHYSTDYVFDGTKSGAYTETDAPNPLSVYGKTKLQGEEAIRQSGCRHLIFRTSWVYATRRHNFARTMLQLARDRTELRVVADQIGVPTSAEFIADSTALCLYRLLNSGIPVAEQVAGIYHLVPAGTTSWHGYARYVIEQARAHGYPLSATANSVHPISTAEYPTPAIRPANSRLDTSKLVNTFGINMPPWQHHVNRLVTELLKQKDI